MMVAEKARRKFSLSYLTLGVMYVRVSGLYPIVIRHNLGDVVSRLPDDVRSIAVEW